MSVQSTTTAFTESKALIKAIIEKMPNIGKWRKDFMVHILVLFCSIRGKINFLQMERYGSYRESTYRKNFAQRFDYLHFNAELIRELGQQEHLIAFDPSYLAKSGKKTFQKGKFWSGCTGQVKPGLEMGGLAVIDVENHTAFHLEAVQTPTKASLQQSGKTLMEHYVEVIVERKDTLESLSDYLIVDAYFGREGFVEAISKQTRLKVISRLRSDAALFYLFTGQPTGKPGRPRKYDGKVNVYAIDKDRFQQQESNPHYALYSAVVYSKALKRKIKAVYVEFFNKQGKVASHKIFFSTDLTLSGKQIFHYYRLRFQIEFLYRDAKQHVGLNTCQAIGENKLHFHWNAALSSVSVAKAVHWIALPKKERKAFSMADVKTLYINQLMLNRFFDLFDIDTNDEKIKSLKQQAVSIGKIAA